MSLLSNHWQAVHPQQPGKVLIYEHYGIAPSIVFRNPNLSVGAKAVYGYLMTFVNAAQAREGDARAWPTRERMMDELNISVNTLTKYLKELKDAELIEVEQNRAVVETEKGGQKSVFARNTYIMQLYVPDPTQCNKKCDTEVRVTESVTLNSCDTQKVNPSNTTLYSNTTSISKTRQDSLVKSSPVDKSVEELPSSQGNELNANFVYLMETIEDISGETLSETDQQVLKQLVCEYGHEDVESATYEYMFQLDLQKGKIKNPIRYIKGVLDKWSVEGKRISDPMEILQRQALAKANS